MRRVVVTGIGLITPLGSGRERVWTALLEGRSGIRQVRAFDTSRFRVHLGAEVQDFDPSTHFQRQDPGTMGRGSQLAVAAGRQALYDAQLDASAYRAQRIGVSLGTTSGEAQFVERYNDIRYASGIEAIPGDIPAKYPCHVIAAHVATEFDFRGPCLMIPTACAAGNYAIGYGFDLIRSNKVDVVLAGGADPFSRMTYMGFARLGAIAPERCQPFDRNRKGMIPGEGAAVLVLESLDTALARSANIYAEVLGYAVTCDSYHMTAGHPQGDGAARAMTRAMKDSGITPDDIGYISAHGTGTPTNDRIESLAIRTVFGERSASVPVSSIKSMLGHTMGAASAIEAAVCTLALCTGMVPPTTNFEEADPDCAIDCVPNQARKVDARYALNNAYAFGGNNASLCLGRYEGNAARVA